MVAGKFGLEAFPPFLSAGIRFVFGIATIWCWCRFRGIKLWPESAEWRLHLQICFWLTLQIALMNFGFAHTSGSSAAILISTNPLFAAVFAHYMLGSDRLDLFRSAGLMLAFAGVVLTLYFSQPLSADTPEPGTVLGNLGDWLCLASAGVLGYRLIFSAIVMQQVDSYRLAFWPTLLSIPAFFVLSGIFESVDWTGFQWSMHWTAVAGLAYQGVVVAGLGFMVSLWLISRYRPSLMASFNFISPVSGVLLSVLLLDESFSASLGVSVGLVALGLIVLTIKSPASN